MPGMADLIAKRYKEWGALAVNKEHIIDWEVLPARANVKFQSYDLTLVGTEDVGATNAMVVDIACWWLPVYAADAMETVSGDMGHADLKTLYDKYVPKVETTALGTAWTPSEADVEMGDADTNLYYQPGKISLETLTNPSTPARLYHRREWLGWAEQSAFRTGDGTKIRYLKNHKGYVRRGVNTMNPGYLVWVLGVPQTVADGEFEVGTTFPVDGEFATLDFLAPIWDPILAARSVGGADLDTWRRWATSWVIEQGDSPVQMKQVALDVRMKRDATFSRHVATGGTVSPDA